MKQDKNEIRWDKLLHIQTMGRDDSNSDQYRYPYEPTPYSVLERLAKRYGNRKGLWGIEVINEPLTENMWDSMNMQERYPAFDRDCQSEI